MTRTIILTIAILALACKVEKTGQDTYKVIAPTPQAKAAAQKVKQQTETAAEKLGGELKKVGQKAKSEAAQVGTKTETRSKSKTHY